MLLLAGTKTLSPKLDFKSKVKTLLEVVRINKSDCFDICVGKNIEAF